ncbi:nonsense-mediated mRNA decay protein, putative [Theileria equi strain WA]|uniref:60S ribosomal export protein NMD3 n=1 Tax=Theileria equi strain WA TaxID=1537102 RepID=L1LF93_THEEQ|nr:nonsense-mediated mRNA decay protein, putative [Theileria equi strain WA]EKX73915.1 nonsense-mediated mRNA decay protein, putative [Theileria equi strain WA]|eukprot:XP_004833367.1 nonsense-mediated mRNA decay protein, putative [Theileria equi strain WA]
MLPLWRVRRGSYVFQDVLYVSSQKRRPESERINALYDLAVLYLRKILSRSMVCFIDSLSTKFRINCELESKELLSLCLKKIKGINLLKIIDAKFNWTEPHSKKLKLQILVQKEVENNCIVEQTLFVEFTIRSTQCAACKQMYTPHTWKALVQIRQKTKDKKHMLLLEQIILKNNAHENVLNILSRRNGFDLHFANRPDAQKFAEFVSDKIVSQLKNSKKLITADMSNNKYNYKYTIHVSLIPVCTDDVVFLTPKVASMYGGISPFLLCVNLTSTITLLDPFTLRKLDISSDKYWRNPFSSLFTKFNLCEFIILNVDRDYSKKWDDSPYELVDVEVMAVNSSKIIYTKSHLGKSLTVGSTFSGYDISRINLNGLSEEETDIENRIPFEVILVRKTKKPTSKHNWVLKRIFTNKKDQDEEMEEIDEDELLDFKDEIMSKKELHNQIDFYRNPKSPKNKTEDEDVNSISVQLKELSLHDQEYF